MRTVVASIEAEYRRYELLGERTLAQLSAEELHARSGDGDNSVSTIVQHLSGNLASRFTDFLTTDGEKPWRERDLEFEDRAYDAAALRAVWSKGWTVLRRALAELDDSHLLCLVAIRQQPLSVIEALHRSLAHTSYHVGQMVYLGKALRGARWSSLSIAPGQSARYNQNPTLERPPAGG